jgi:DNA-binding CsgD family transcriptional regulator
MQTQKILAFSDFLARSPKSYTDIAKFLVMNTFSEEKFNVSYIGELTETGVVCPIGGFGWTQQQYSTFADIPIQANYPITQAIRENSVLFFYPDQLEDNQTREVADYGVIDNWESGVAIPAYPIGGLALVSQTRIESSDSARVFYIAIGSLLGLYASRLPAALIEEAINVKHKINVNQAPLTDRQFVIAGMLERGFNNAQIGLEIGYSESLIRQETVAIYKKLQVTGREAMQAIRTLHLESEGFQEL